VLGLKIYNPIYFQAVLRIASIKYGKDQGTTYSRHKWNSDWVSNWRYDYIYCFM